MLKKPFLKILTVTFLSIVASYAGSFIDSIIISRFLNSDALAATAFVNPIVIFVECLAGSIAAGTQTLAGKAIGKGNSELANKYFFSGVIIIIVISIIIIAGSLMFMDPLLSLIGATKQTGQLRDLVNQYLSGYLLTVPLIMLVALFLPIIQIDSNGKIGLISLICLFVFNILGDLFVVLVLHGGLFEIAFATVCAYFLDCLILGSNFLKPDSVFKLKPHSINKKTIWNILSNSIPTIVNRISAAIRNIILNHVNYGIGQEVSVTAYSVMSRITIIYSSICKAFGQATLIVCSVISAQKNPDIIKQVLTMILKYSVIISVAFSAFAAITSPYSVIIFLDVNNPAYNCSVESILIFSFSIILYSITSIFINFYQSTGRVRYASTLSFVDNFVFMVPLIIILPNFLGMTGIWIACSFSRIFTIVIIYIVACMKNKKIFCSLKDLMLLMPEYTDNNKKHLTIRVNNQNEISKYSKKAKFFCEYNNIKNSRANKVSYCIEETLNNIFKYGIRKKNQYALIYITIVEDKVYVLIMDNCKKFDGKNWIEANRFSDNDNISLKLIDKLSETYLFENIIDLNFVHIAI